MSLTLRPLQAADTPAYRRLVQAALAEAFRCPETEQVTLSVAARNAAANRLYESLSFRKCGRLGNYFQVNGRAVAQRFVVRWRPEANYPIS